MGSSIAAPRSARSISLLPKRAPADIRQYGPEDNEGCNDEGAEHAGPEANAAERDEERGLLSRERETQLVRQQRTHGHCQQYPRRPHNCDPERELNRLSQHAFARPPNFTESGRNDTIG